jgi:chromosome segregation ATPase
MEILTNPVFLALVGTLFGSAGLKVIEHWLSRAKFKEDAALKMRDELRLEIDRKAKDYAGELDRLRVEISHLDLEKDEIEKHLDRWREKYYALMEENIQIKSELKSALTQIHTSALLHRQDQVGPDA